MLSSNNRIIIAAAGSGKTTELVDSALSLRSKNVLITTYTDNNTSEIINRLISKNKCVPPNITVLPWFTFLLRHWVRPFQGKMYNGRINGLYLSKGQSTQYVKKENTEKYYLTKDFKIYSDKLAGFGKECNKLSNGAVVDRLTALYDYVLVDELQDITGEDLDVLGLLIESKISTLYVGDPRQSTFSSNNSRKNKSFKKQNLLSYFSKYVKKKLCSIDSTSLNINYRCTAEICRLANKLYPNMSQVESGNNIHVAYEGLFLVKPKDIRSFILKTNALQLRDSIKEASIDYEYQFMNIGYAKGMTVDSVLIYPTKPMLKWLMGVDELKDGSRCRLYIAITRARYCVGFVCDYNEDTKVNGFELYKPHSII